MSNCLVSDGTIKVTFLIKDANHSQPPGFRRFYVSCIMDESIIRYSKLHQKDIVKIMLEAMMAKFGEKNGCAICMDCGAKVTVGPKKAKKIEE